MTQEQEIINIKTPKVYKNKKLNQANFGDFNITAYQVFLHLISKIGGVDTNGKYLQPSELKRNHLLYAQEFMKVFGSNKSNTYRYLKNSIDKLLNTEIKIPKNKSYKRINICEEAEYFDDHGYIEITFTQKIMPYLAQVREKFVLYNLQEIKNFRSIYTARLYEALQEYKETGYMIKSVEQLRELFAVGEKHKQYRDFKRKTFAKACNEINCNFDIELTFQEIKEGRSVVAVKFSFKKTEILEAINPQTGEAKNIYKKPKQKTQKHSKGKHEDHEIEQLSIENMISKAADKTKIQNS